MARSPALRNVSFPLGVFMPGIVALALTRYRHGTLQRRNQLNSLNRAQPVFRKPFHRKGRQGTQRKTMLSFAFFAVNALPRMSRPLGLEVASIALGVVWASWHLALFFVLDGDTVGQSFPFYLLQVTAISVALVWVYMKTGGSLLITMLLHASINKTKDIVPSVVPDASSPWRLRASLTGWLTLTILWLCAAWFLLDMRRDRTVARLRAS